MVSQFVTKFIAAFVALILGLAFLTQIAGVIGSTTDLATSTDTINIGPARVDAANVSSDYNFTLANAVYQTWQQPYPECEVTSITLQNGSGTTITPTTEYVFTADIARLNLINSTKYGNTSNVTTATYTYCPTGYLTGWAATTINIIPGLFAIALLAVAVGLFYSLAKDTGMMG